MTNFTWETTFLDLFDHVLKRYRSSTFHWERDYLPEHLAFLRSVGYRPREFFDFVEDYADRGEPSPGAAVLVASVRRDYLRTVQKGVISSRQISPSALPPKDAELEGIRWLPRILVKAEGKLRGELDPDIMYSCGGDRAFLREHDIHPADFLRVVWASQGDHQKILSYIKSPPRLTESGPV